MCRLETIKSQGVGPYWQLFNIFKILSHLRLFFFIPDSSHVHCPAPSFDSALVLLHTEGLGGVQRVGHRWSSQHVHSEPVFLHWQGLVRGDLEPGSGRGGCGQSAIMAAQHRGEVKLSCTHTSVDLLRTWFQLVCVGQNVKGVTVRTRELSVLNKEMVFMSPVGGVMWFKGKTFGCQTTLTNRSPTDVISWHNWCMMMWKMLKLLPSFLWIGPLKPNYELEHLIMPLLCFPLICVFSLQH